MISYLTEDWPPQMFFKFSGPGGIFRTLPIIYGGAFFCENSQRLLIAS